MEIGHRRQMQKLVCMEVQWHLYFQPHLVAPHMHLKVLEIGFIIWGKGSWIENLLTEWVATKIPMFLLWMFQSLKSLGTQWRKYLIMEVARAPMHQFLQLILAKEAWVHYKELVLQLHIALPKTSLQIQLLLNKLLISRLSMVMWTIFKTLDNPFLCWQIVPSLILG